MFAFTVNEVKLSICLLCKENLWNNEKSNLERYFQNKHLIFVKNYPTVSERKQKTISDLQQKIEASKHSLNKLFIFLQSSTTANILTAEGVVRKVKPFTDSEFIKEAF